MWIQILTVKGIIILLTFSCQPSRQDNKKLESSETVMKAPIVNNNAPNPQPLLTLLNLSSTSDQPGFEVENLFDELPHTYWKSKNGTGPNECISLSFIGDGAWISKINVEALVNENTTENDEINLYINDVLFTATIASSIRVDTLVTRLEICLKASKSMIFNRFEVDKEVIAVGSFPENKSIGLKSIQLFNAEERLFHVMIPKKIKGRLAPSSNLNPLSKYHAGYLFDGKKEHAWVEGSENSGIGDSILFQIDQPVCINKMTIWNGQQATEKQFYANARIQSFTFAPIHEDDPVIYQLIDSYGQEDVFLKTDSSSNWILSIIDVYRGDLFTDLAISELLFFDCESQPFIIESGLPEQFQNEILSQTENTILENFLDHCFYNEILSEDKNGYTRKSLVLHTDGVCSLLFDYFNDKTQVKNSFMAIGYWNIVDLNAANTIKLYLSARKLSNIQSQEISLFEEELTIKPGIIEGSGLLGRFYTE